MTKTRILLSDSTDPWFNLAVEDTIFRSMPADQRVLFLWRNADTVVIGRAQNPWRECKTDRMEQDKVKLARRQTGGGAVFHDLGNTNFTFMAGKPEYDKEVSTKIVLAGLQKLGIHGSPTGAMIWYWKMNRVFVSFPVLLIAKRWIADFTTARCC